MIAGLATHEYANRVAQVQAVIGNVARDLDTTEGLAFYRALVKYIATRIGQLERVGQAHAYPEAYVLTEEEIGGVQTLPNGAQASAINAYRTMYASRFGYWPHGVHYIPVEGEPETAAVWFAVIEGGRSESDSC